MSTSALPHPPPSRELHFEPNELPKIRSQPGLPIDSGLVGWLRETAPDTALEEMRARFDEDGYVFVKGVIPREDVLDMRENYFSHFQSTGILAPGTSPREGIFDASKSPDDHTGIGAPSLAEDITLRDKIVSAHVTPAYLSFLQHPALREFIRNFMGWKKDVLLSRTLLRHTIPSAQSTGIHYDQIFLRGGNPADEFLTAWVPIGDIAVDGGGLMYLEDSTELGRKIEAEFASNAGNLTDEQRINAFNVNMMTGGQLSSDAEAFGRERGSGKRWLASKYEAGDVVFHNPYIIHGAAMNEDQEGRIRLSTDLRFYEEGMRLDKRWMQVFTIGDGL